MRVESSGIRAPPGTNYAIETFSSSEVSHKCMQNRPSYLGCIRDKTGFVLGNFEKMKRSFPTRARLLQSS